ncbi:MAG: CapA family protein [Gemmatimonadota bacterium]|nr:CapA family protein [Gemmatimonadota bacterium]
MKRVILWFAVMGVLTPAHLTGQQTQPHRDGLGDITIALAGDAIITRQLRVFEEPEFLEIRDVIRGATTAFVNAEMLFFDYDEPEIIPSSQSGGTYMRAEPELADELAWMGFDMVSTANNHSLDFSYGGLRSNNHWLRQAGLVAAGTGENLAEARAPKYLDTPGGRVALISVSSSFADFNRAGPQRKDMRGRPGLNPLRVETTYYVPEAEFQQLSRVRGELGMGGRGGDDRIQFMGATFVRSDEFAVTNVVNAYDLEEITASVSDAKQQANWVIVSSHTHQGGAGVADFFSEFTHAVIDAGADIFVGHGPHVLRGIEIYKGRPIFYSLGNFLMENETVELQPWENYDGVDLDDHALPGDFYTARIERSGGSFPAQAAYWEAVVAVPVFRGGDLTRIDLHPITMGHGLERPQRGRPLAAKGDLARTIITRLQELSRPLGTEVNFENGIGVIRVGRAGREDGP